MKVKHMLEKGAQVYNHKTKEFLSNECAEDEVFAYLIYKNSNKKRASMYTTKDKDVRESAFIFKRTSPYQGDEWKAFLNGHEVSVKEAMDFIKGAKMRKNIQDSDLLKKRMMMEEV